MIFSLLKRRSKGQGIQPLYGALMANALNPHVYLAGGVPDTFEGRFEAVTLHAALLLRRLKALPAPADQMSQELVDRVFDGLDSAMRETGISDVGVPKRMKTFAKGFYGRLEAYTAALDSGDRAALTDVLSRNLCEGAPAKPALVTYVEETAARLDSAGLETFVAGRMPRGDWTL